MNKNPLLIAAVLALAAPSGLVSAEDLEFKHPAKKAVVTVHWDNPKGPGEAITYDGPAGFYHVTRQELFMLSVPDPKTRTLQRFHRLDRAALVIKADSANAERAWAYGDQSILAELESIIARLKTEQEKKDVVAEAAARTTDIRKRLTTAKTRVKALELAAGVTNPRTLPRLSVRHEARRIEVAAAKAEKYAAIHSSQRADARPVASDYHALFLTCDALENDLGQLEESLNALGD